MSVIVQTIYFLRQGCSIMSANFERQCRLLAFSLLFTSASAIGQTGILYSFGNTGDGLDPNSTVTEVAPNVFLGAATTSLFGINSSGGFKTLGPFPSAAGTFTEGQLYPASDGLLYGANESGVGTVTGSIFSTDLGGAVKVLKANTYFASSLIEASDGNLYGVSAPAEGEDFVVNRVTKSGIVTPMYTLGQQSVAGPLVQATDGNLYGSTIASGEVGGFIFRISLEGVFTKLSSFGSYVGGQGGLIQASNGLLYGITYGDSPTCPEDLGSIFSLSLSGEYRTLHLLYSCYPIGYGPSAGLVEGSDGYLYGVTGLGGIFLSGSIFKIATNGSDYTTLVNLSGPPSIGPTGGPGPAFVQAADGSFYGTANGGMHNFGAVYRYDAGLPPPLPAVRRVQPDSGASGSTVLITGTHLIGLRGVSFNGVPATKIVSRGVYYAFAVVPPGATTGPVTVTTVNGSGTSKKDFMVQ